VLSGGLESVRRRRSKGRQARKTALRRKSAEGPRRSFMLVQSGEGVKEWKQASRDARSTSRNELTTHREDGEGAPAC